MADGYGDVVSGVAEDVDDNDDERALVADDGDGDVTEGGDVALAEERFDGRHDRATLGLGWGLNAPRSPPPSR